MVYFVGAGSGAADLITVRGMHMLQQADVIVVDVYVAEDVVEDGAQHVARTEELFDTSGVHTLDDGFLTPRLFAEDGARGGLLDGDGQDLLAGLR